MKKQNQWINAWIQSRLGDSTPPLIDRRIGLTFSLAGRRRRHGKSQKTYRGQIFKPIFYQMHINYKRRTKQQKRVNDVMTGLILPFVTLPRANVPRIYLNCIINWIHFHLIVLYWVYQVIVVKMIRCNLTIPTPVKY